MSTDSAIAYEGHMDPTDLIDYVGEFGPLLEPGEVVNNIISVEPVSEAQAVGFEISTSTPPALEVGDENVVYWVNVNPSNIGDDVWCFGGFEALVEITVGTNQNRRYQRTFLITVREL